MHFTLAKPKDRDADIRKGTDGRCHIPRQAGLDDQVSRWIGYGRELAEKMLTQVVRFFGAISHRADVHLI
jgi:hypothetical protein